MTTFDYSLVPVETGDAARKAADRINTRLRNASKDIIAVGRDLAEQKEKLGHGHFLNWIAVEFNMSERTARNFMSVFHKFGESAKVADLRPSVLYVLSAASTPPEVREQAIERAAAGETVTLDDIKVMKAECVAERKTEKCTSVTIENTQKAVQLKSLFGAWNAAGDKARLKFLLNVIGETSPRAT
ncbi:DUF3102 domain-containing protein [Ensifer sp. 22460]|uniref:DUF3102 domain-containing protein n=1 Tax=Ensifer sp. 22460 TaxID=3453922 RepID=UPI003F82DE13